MRETIWTYESIKRGIDRFYHEHSRYPTAIDFDTVSYLPSARQVQRKFGGMEQLRRELQYDELNYTKGNLRRASYDAFAQRSLSAEDTLELTLVDHFGELFVHTQKRYYRMMKNRWDFFVYYDGGYLGIDIFSTSRIPYILRNVNHKLRKYADVPAHIPIYFVVDGEMSDDEIASAVFLSGSLQAHKNISVISLPAFLSYIKTLIPLVNPPGVTLVLRNDDIEQK